MSRVALLASAVAAVVATACVIGVVALANAATSSGDAPPSAAVPTAAAPTRIVVIGDSIAAGLNLDDGEAWPDLLSDDLGIPVVNDSCSGAGFVAVGDCDTAFAGLIDDAVAANPDLVIIQSSDNDSGHGAATIEKATKKTIDALHAALPDAQIVGVSTLYNKPGREPAEIAASSAALQNAVLAVGGKFVDLAQPLRGQIGLMQDDSEHPTAEGQQVLVQALIDAFAQAGITL